MRRKDVFCAYVKIDCKNAFLKTDPLVFRAVTLLVNSVCRAQLYGVFYKYLFIAGEGRVRQRWEESLIFTLEVSFFIALGIPFEISRCHFMCTLENMTLFWASLMLHRINKASKALSKGLLLESEWQYNVYFSKLLNGSSYHGGP